METLGEYVSRVMDEKNLKVKDVERRAGGIISDSYVTNIMNGVATNLTIEKLNALAVGLGVDKVELFKVASGIKDPEETWTPQSLIRLLQKILSLKSSEIKQIKKILKIE
jgi:transcriptional regulator with XRE-family HTH domain